MGDRATALVVANDATQRNLVTLLLEESDMHVVQCESAEAAELVLDHIGGRLCMMFTDVDLAGTMSGVELGSLAISRFPQMSVIVTSIDAATAIPRGATFMQKPWMPLDVVREANNCWH